MPKPTSDRLNALQLRHFRLIHAIADLGQLSLAAAGLRITQPAASRLLAEIERTVGEAIFERHPKGMTPTPIGEALVRHAANLLHELDETTKEVEAFRSGKTGAVRVGAVTGPAVRFVVAAIQALKRDSPQVDISVDVAPSRELMTGLVTGRYDFILARVPPEFDARRLDIGRGRVEEIAFLVREGHRLLDERSVDLDRLSHLSWVIQGPGMPIREAVEQKFMNRQIPVPRDVVSTASLLFTIAYLQHSDAIAAASQEVIDLLLTSNVGGLQTLAVNESIILSAYHLIRWNQRRISPMAEKLYHRVLMEMTVNT